MLLVHLTRVLSDMMYRLGVQFICVRLKKHVNTQHTHGFSLKSTKCLYIWVKQLAISVLASAVHILKLERYRED